MKIICGLGNPGKQYELTHHNMGFLTVETIAEKLNIEINKLKFKALIGEGFVDGEKVILVKPQTFMNSSGEALKPLMDFYKAKPEELLVIYDDIDLPKGKLRIRSSGSAGTHNGMRSVIYQLQYDNFPRLRVGIGNGGDIPLINYVTMSLTKEEEKILEPAINSAADAALLWIKQGIDIAMRDYNGK